VSSLSHIIFRFAGKDLASLPEIALAAVCVTCAWWPNSDSFAAGSDMFELVFAFLYSIWGMNHACAIACPTLMAMLIAVLLSFVSFLLAGIKPPLGNLMHDTGVYGPLLLLMSPIRWAYTRYIYMHVSGYGSPYVEMDFYGRARGHLNGLGFNIDKLCPGESMPILERWRNGNGWGCHSGQLFMQGVLFRFIATMILLLTSSAKASGGQLSFGVTSIFKSRVLQDAVYIFLFFLALYNFHILGGTY